MRFEVILFESIIWSLLWMLFVAILVRIFPFMIEHDYPIDVQKVANIKKPNKNERVKGYIFGIISFLFLLALPIVYTVSTYSSDVSFFILFIHIWIICMTWNAVDLLIVDWLFICILSFKPFMLPGSEEYEGNKNYKYHFKGFVKGFFVMSFFAFILSLISYGIIKYI
ncbi:MAG: hypothetical protein CSB16_01340 [Clostridiales bacterium]|nr:MAG: hypothetical protein CSB16_01340 [Clostridiales bacterium]